MVKNINELFFLFYTSTIIIYVYELKYTYFEKERLSIGFGSFLFGKNTQNRHNLKLFTFN